VTESGGPSIGLWMVAASGFAVGLLPAVNENGRDVFRLTLASRSVGIRKWPVVFLVLFFGEWLFILGQAPSLDHNVATAALLSLLFAVAGTLALRDLAWRHRHIFRGMRSSNKASVRHDAPAASAGWREIRNAALHITPLQHVLIVAASIFVIVSAEALRIPVSVFLFVYIVLLVRTVLRGRSSREDARSRHA